jgi:hypothetical protein
MCELCTKNIFEELLSKNIHSLLDVKHIFVHWRGWVVVITPLVATGINFWLGGEDWAMCLCGKNLDGHCFSPI